MFSDRIRAEEFENPQRIDGGLVECLHELRDLLGRPMYFTYHRGIERHPWGDACPPHSGAHSDYSLHKWGILHARSVRENRLVLKNSCQGLACDWDAGDPDAEALFDTYLTVERINRFNGIGLYPNWNNRGLHVDRRPRTHPYYRARWFADRQGAYTPLTWKAYKKEWL